MAWSNDDSAHTKVTIDNIKLFATVVIIANVALSVVLFITFAVILTVLCTKVRRKSAALTVRLKEARRFVREEFSPNADEFLAVFDEVQVKENKIIDLYTTFDSTRRRVVEKWLKCDVSATARRLSVFQSFLSESNFIKGAGFRMHRLLHESRIQTYPDGEEGRTILAPPFKQSPLRRVNATPGAPITAAGATGTGVTEGVAAEPGVAAAVAQSTATGGVAKSGGGKKGTGAAKIRTLKQ